MIHKYQLNGYNIVLDVNSGGIHLCDDLTYKVLDHFRKISNSEIIELFKAEYSIDELNETIEELETLVKEGNLYSEDRALEVIEKIENRQPVVKAICLHVAHDCNLKCKYCFAEEGEYGGKRELMSLDVAKKSLEFLAKSSGTRHNLEIDFFGGEPLMNFDVVKETVEYGKELGKKYNKDFRFTFTTNGVLLNDEIIKYSTDNMETLVLSIDGRKEVNDKIRPTPNGKGSYDIIMPKFKEVAEIRNQEGYNVRGTFTRHNLDFSKDVLHLADEGFKQISLEPVVSSEDNDYYIREEDLPQIFDEYEKLAVEMIKRRDEGKGFNFFHFLIDLTGGACMAKRVVGCGAGTEYLSITPNGDLYPCHQFVGHEEFKIGTIYDGVQNLDLRSEFESCNVYSKEECRVCWNRFYCSGGCAANSYYSNGDIKKPYDIGCQLQMKRSECAIMLKVDQMIKGNL